MKLLYSSILPQWKNTEGFRKIMKKKNLNNISSLRKSPSKMMASHETVLVVHDPPPVYHVKNYDDTKSSTIELTVHE